MALQSKIHTLTGQLQELYAASFADEPLQALVPSPGGKRFYSASCWHGRFLTFIYSHCKRCDGHWRQEKMKTTITHIHNLYCELFAKAETHNETIRYSISERIHGKQINEKNLKEAKRFLTAWNTAITPFFNGINQRDQAFLDFIGFPSVGDELIASPFGNRVQLASFARYQNLIDFEGQIGSQIPLRPLYRVAKKAPLTVEEIQSLERFARKINKKSSPLDISQLNTNVRALVKCFEEEEEGLSPYILENIASMLIEKNHLIIKQHDPDHLRWRQALKPGDRLNCNGKDIILGAQIGAKMDAFDNNLIFESANDPGSVVVIGVNKLILPVMAHLNKQKGFGIKSAKCLAIEENGLFALVERLNTNLAMYEWKSTEDKYDNDDLDLLHAIVVAIRWFIHQDKVATHFSPEYLMYDAQGVLKCTKYTEPQPFSFINLEQSIRKFLKGNEALFRYLMIGGIMRKHPSANYFHSIVLASCRGEDPEPDIRSQIKKVKNFHYVDRAKELVQTIESIRSNTLSALKAKHGRLPKNAEEIINKNMWDLYLQSEGVSTYPQNLEELVIQSVC